MYVISGDSQACASRSAQFLCNGYVVTALQVTQISIGRFHHFHLARQLERHHLLSAIYTGYPRFKLKDEPGIPSDKIHSFPWLQTPYMLRGVVGLDRFVWLNRTWEWWAQQSLDHYVSSKLTEPTVLIALSGSGLHSGLKAQLMGGLHICDRGSSHIRVQNRLLTDEYQRYGQLWPGIDPRVIAKEEAEYQQADLISVPSQFCYDSFVSQGISAHKLLKIPYGARLERFKANPTKAYDDQSFNLLFVGAAGPRKGFIDLLKAFELIHHPRKRLVLIGSISAEARELLDSFAEPDMIQVVGTVANAQLQQYYNQASVFVLPSIEEGLAMVIGEAMACGCPVVATTNTGAAELITDGVEGFILPIHSPDAIADRLQLLADDAELRQTMSQAALARVQQLGGWDVYGETWRTELTKLQSHPL